MKHFFHFFRNIHNSLSPICKSAITSAVLIFGTFVTTAQTITIEGSQPDSDVNNTWGPMATHAMGAAWSRHGYVYPASLLQGLAVGSTISSIEWQVFSQSFISGPLDFKIYLRESYLSEFVGDSSWADYKSPATLVYSGNPSSLLSAFSANDYKRFPLSPNYTYKGGSLMVLVEYSQQGAPLDAGYWSVEGNPSQPAYTNKQCKHITGTGALPANSQFASSSAMHPVMKINYTAPALQNDLTITAANPANGQSVVAGSLVNFSVTVKNVGTLPQSAKPVRFLLDGIFITDTAKTPNLSAGQSASVVVTRTILTEGNHRIEYIITPTGDQNPSNNELTTFVTATPAPIQKDLALTTAVSPTNGQQVTAGTVINLAAKVKNMGTLAQSGATVSCSIDGVPYADSAKTPNLLSGQEATLTVTNASFTPGSHTIVYRVTLPGDEVATNNSLTINITAVAPAIQQDLSITAANSPVSGQEVVAGTPIELLVTIKNMGAASSPSGAMVRCRVDGVLYTDTARTRSLLSGQSAIISVAKATFTPGSHAIQYEIVFAADEKSSNNVLNISISAKEGTTPSSTIFFDSANTSANWFANSKLWTLDNVMEPNDSIGVAFMADFFQVVEGVKDTLISPLINLGLPGSNRPVLSYYYAHQTYTIANPEPDKLEVIISTNGGLTWSAPLLTKAANTSPSLRTNIGTSAPNNFIPLKRSDWRHEQIDLFGYANNSNVRIGFVATSGYGNRLFINDIAVKQAVPIAGLTTNLATQTIAVTGPQPTVGGVTLNFASIVPNGKASIAKHAGEPNLSKYKTNTSATTANGLIFTPNTLSADYWYTASYDGAANYSISIDITGITNAPLPSELYIMKRSDQTDAWTALNTTLAGNVLTAAGLTSFSEFAIGSRVSSNPLPLQLISFAGSRTTTGNLLRWQSANENNTDYFLLERSSNGSMFSPISKTEAVGSGNNAYEFIDANTKGTAYYRLKMVDKDGKTNYSAVVRLTTANNTGFRVYPNPAKGNTTLQYESKKNELATIRFMNAAGQTVLTKQQAVTPGTNAISLAVANLPAGTYIVELHAGGTIETVRLVKQ